MNSTEEKLMKAVDYDDILQVSILASKIDSLEFKTPEGWTPLIKAVHKGNFIMAKFLVDLGASIHATNHKGTTVFMYAKTPVFESRDVEILEWLLEKGADINATNNRGLTVLDYVKEKGDDSLQDWMIDCGAKYSSDL